MDATLGYGAYYRYGATDRALIGAGAGNGWPDAHKGRGAALAEAQYALIAPKDQLKAVEFLTMSFDAAWQGFDDNGASGGGFQVEGDLEGVRGSRLLFDPGVYLGLGDKIAVFRVGARAQIVRLLECESTNGSPNACDDHRPTRHRRFVNGIGELGLELKFQPVTLYVVGAVATDRNLAIAGGLSFRFGGLETGR